MGDWTFWRLKWFASGFVFSHFYGWKESKEIERGERLNCDLCWQA